MIISKIGYDIECYVDFILSHLDPWMHCTLFFFFLHQNSHYLLLKKQLKSIEIFFNYTFYLFALKDYIFTMLASCRCVALGLKETRLTTWELQFHILWKSKHFLGQILWIKKIYRDCTITYICISLR